jgi:hypothetical protein
MKGYYVLAAAAAMLVSGTAHAQLGDWRTWGPTGEGPKVALMMVDASSLESPNATTREIDTASYFKNEQFLGDDPYSVLWIRYRLDCAARTYQIIGSAAWYREESVISSDNALTVNPISAGSLMDRTLTAACGRTVNQAPKIKGASPESEGRRHFAQ